MKIINWLLFLLFGIFAVVQFNDPDPFLWILIYGIVAITCLLRNIGFFQRTMVMIIFFLIVVYALLNFPHVMEWVRSEDRSTIFGEMVANREYIEGTREFFGLLMAASALAYQLFGIRSK